MRFFPLIRGGKPGSALTHAKRSHRRAPWHGRPGHKLTFEPLEDRRMLSGGQLDLTFGTDGKVLTDIGIPSAEFGRDLNATMQPDGKIVVAGYTDADAPGGVDFFVVRYNQDGSLDTSFDTDGKQTIDFGNTEDQAYGVAVDSVGRIVVVGFTGASRIENRRISSSEVLVLVNWVR